MKLLCHQTETFVSLWRNFCFSLRKKLKLGDTFFSWQVIRGLKVLLDSDVAALYGVETKRVNEAVKNNQEKFPSGYIIELTDKEMYPLRSKYSTANLSSKVRVNAKAFSEKGLYMLATILRSPQATETTIAIIESFTKLRDFSRNISSVIQTSDPQIQKSLLERSSELINDLLDTDGDILESESTIELNLAILKMKRTVKKKTKG